MYDPLPGIYAAAMPRTPTLKLAVFVHNAGAHPGGWRRHDSGAERLHDFDFYRELAQTAERGKFDMFFSGDAQGHMQIEGRDNFASTDSAARLEPTTLLGALAVVTSRIGLVATASTTYNEPYALARRFASLDHLSHGRAGWNAVTSTTNSEARNFGRDANMDHDQRYDRAEEFVDVVTALWDSWEDDAFLHDREAGRFFDPDKAHATAHEGRFFRVAGPLNVARSPQGRPVIVQAGSSGPGRRLSARIADAVFTAQASIDKAKLFYTEMKQAAAEFGRDPRHMLILPSIQCTIRSTDAEARRAQDEMQAMMPDGLAISRLQMLLGGVDLSGHAPEDQLPPVPLTAGGQAVQQQIVDMARTEKLSIRALARRVSVSRAALSLVGSPERAADVLEQWFREGAADGFALSPEYLPGGLTEFVDHVVPILQQRGLFRTEYEGTTLREHLGLPRPENGFVAFPERHREPLIWASAQAGGE